MPLFSGRSTARSIHGICHDHHLYHAFYDHHGTLQRSGNESFFQRVFKRNDTGGCEHGIPAPEGESAGISVSDKLREEGFDLTAFRDDYVDMGIYATDQLTMGLTIGDNMETVTKNFMFLSADQPEDIVRLSDYNRLAKLYGSTQYDLRDDEYLVLCNMDEVKLQRDKMLKKGEKILLDGISYSPKYDQCQDGFYG